MHIRAISFCWVYWTRKRAIYPLLLVIKMNRFMLVRSMGVGSSKENLFISLCNEFFLSITIFISIRDWLRWVRTDDTLIMQLFTEDWWFCWIRIVGLYQYIMLFKTASDFIMWHTSSTFLVSCFFYLIIISLGWRTCILKT